MTGGSRVNGRRPVVVGIGGSTRPDSTGEKALRVALAGAAEAGAETVMLTARDLNLRMYAPERDARTDVERRLITELARADGIIVSSPGYHGGVSGLIKNALDYVEDLRDADPPYLDRRAVGCIACASGLQAAVTTLVSLRSVVHALRGWPTPLGVTVNSALPVFAADGTVADESLAARLRVVGHQVVEFATCRVAGGEQRSIDKGAIDG